MNFVCQKDIAFGVGAEFIFCIDKDQAVLRSHFLPSGEKPQGNITDLVPLRLGQQLFVDDLSGGQRGVMAPIEFLGGGSDDRCRQCLVVAQTIGERVAVHFPFPLLV